MSSTAKEKYPHKEDEHEDHDEDLVEEFENEEHLISFMMKTRMTMTMMELLKRMGRRGRRKNGINHKN